MNNYVRFLKETPQDTRHLALIKGRGDYHVLAYTFLITIVRTSTVF